MPLFRRRSPVVPASYRVTAVTQLPGTPRSVNGMPHLRYHLSGIVTADGLAPTAYAVDQVRPLAEPPQVGAVLAAGITRRHPLELELHWPEAREQAAVLAVESDAQAGVIAHLLQTGTVQTGDGTAAGDALRYAAVDPDFATKIAQQVSGALGTPMSYEVREGDTTRTVHVGGGGHLSSAEAAELLRSGTATTATITAARQVDVPAFAMPSPEASLWDVDLQVHRADGTAYAATTRVGFRTAARRGVLGEVGLTIPVRVDPADEARVAVDGTTYDATHPGAPAG